MKAKIKALLKAKLIEMAINGEFDQADLTQLDMDKFDKVLQPVVDLETALSDLATNADEDCPQGSRTKHFTAALDAANELLEEK